MVGGGQGWGRRYRGEREGGRRVKRGEREGGGGRAGLLERRSLQGGLKSLRKINED